ncbi:MAG: precorrin-3B C(17)-methyltransferase [Streptosporangiales bacterium]|nr:precorrin-3B C(17)-methyltransferase [Streptosporangiales bacterium]
MIGLVAVTERGRSAAARLAAAWPRARVYEGPAGQAVPRAFAECGGLVCFLAVGAAVRIIGPLLHGKHSDPGVVCVDESLRFAVPVAGGHAGGANALAERVSAELGCTPVITTASDALGITPLDDLGADLGFRVEDGSDLAAVGAAVISGERVTLTCDGTWPLPALPPNVVSTPAPEPGTPAILVTDRVLPPPLGRDLAEIQPGGLKFLQDHGQGAAVGPRVVYRPPSLAVGVGASRGVAADEVLGLVDAALAEAGLSAASVLTLATVQAKADEAGIRTAAERRGWPMATYPAEVLADVGVPNPSEAVRVAVGTPSVAEAAALYAAGARGELVVAKRRSSNATVAVARLRPRGRLTFVGVGPGDRDLLPPRAVAVLRRASVVIGLDQYVEAVSDLFRPGTRVLASGLGAEEERASAAVAEARGGHAVALLGSGDAGIYAMASPALEMADGSIDVAGVPGVTAALAAAALLGAPLGNDHALISLSDLHTPWEVIEARVRAAAEADFVVVFYNPRSVARHWQLARALAVLGERRRPETPVGIVRGASRPDERSTLTTLDAVDVEAVDMQTVVIVGSGDTRIVAGRMVTPRGYRWL